MPTSNGDAQMSNLDSGSAPCDIYFSLQKLYPLTSCKQFSTHGHQSLQVALFSKTLPAHQGSEGILQDINTALFSLFLSCFVFLASLSLTLPHEELLFVNLFLGPVMKLGEMEAKKTQP